jgi:hypothetical protein
MELDIWIPSLSIGFEYQGSHHYSAHSILGSPAVVQSRDQEKQTTCKQYGITLFHVPYWWKKDTDTLVAMIHSARPDVILKNTTTDFLAIK